MNQRQIKILTLKSISEVNIIVKIKGVLLESYKTSSPPKDVVEGSWREWPARWKVTPDAKIGSVVNISTIDRLYRAETFRFANCSEVISEFCQLHHIKSCYILR